MTSLLDAADFSYHIRPLAWMWGSHLISMLIKEPLVSSCKVSVILLLLLLWTYFGDSAWLPSACLVALFQHRSWYHDEGLNKSLIALKQHRLFGSNHSFPTFPRHPPSSP